MIIVEKNVGTKIEYAVTNRTIMFAEDLSLNLAKREKDDPEHIDICFDADRNLVIGAAAGRAYVAEIDIPARVYRTETIEGEEQRIPVPLDMNTVTLSLWAV